MSGNRRLDLPDVQGLPDGPLHQGHVEIQTVPAVLSSVQRSLLSELELKAEWRRCPLMISSVNVSPRLSAPMHSFDRRWGGVRTGVSDAVVLLPEGVDCFDPERLASQVAATLRADLTMVRVVSTQPLSAPPHMQRRHVSTHHGRRGKIWAEYRDIRQVLRLETSFQAFLAKLGRGTRRNVETCRHNASRLGMNFRCVLGGLAVDTTALAELAQHNMPNPTQPRKLAGVFSVISRQSLPFHAGLTGADGRLISVAGGFIDGSLACLLYQCNHRADRDLGPSLIMRSILIEQLISDGVRELAFVGGCSGVLVHACDRVRAADMLVVQTSLKGVAKHWLAQTFDQRGRVARLSDSIRDPVIA